MSTHQHNPTKLVAVATISFMVSLALLLLPRTSSPGSVQEVIDGVRSVNSAAYSAVLVSAPDLNAQDSYGRTALRIASHDGKSDHLTMLLDGGADTEIAADIYGAPLHAAAAEGNLAIIQTLVNGGANVDALNEDGETPLWIAVRCGQGGAVALLLELNASVSTQDLQGSELLCCAIEQGSLAVVSMLLDQGIDPNEPSDSSNCRPLHLAARSGSLELVRLLLQRGATSELRDELGRTASECALQAGHPEIADELLHLSH